jgi:ASCH domain
MSLSSSSDLEVKRLRGLMVREPWASLILRGKKTWEIRGTRTSHRGEIYIIRSGTGRVVGSCRIIDVLGPLTMEDMRLNVETHLTPESELILGGLPYRSTYAWVLAEPRTFEEPIPYKHPSGAITWVDLNELREELPCRRA